MVLWVLRCARIEINIKFCLKLGALLGIFHAAMLYSGPSKVLPMQHHPCQQLVSQS
jgi:hypothetical protein